MAQQRSNAANRLHEAGPLILQCSNELYNNVPSRSETFKNLIGFVGQKDGKDVYHTLSPILFAEDPDQPDRNWTMFRHPMLMKVSAKFSPFFNICIYIKNRHIQHSYAVLVLSKVSQKGM